MSTTLEAIRPIELAEVQEARKRIAGTIVRTPLIRLELGPDCPDIRLKLENLQPINAYKLRGAANAVAMLSESERKRGVWTISAGNAGQGVAYAARQASAPCTVVVIETAPKSKLERMRALRAKLIPVTYDAAWKALDELSFEKGAPQVFENFEQSFVDGAGGQSVFPRMWERMKPVVDGYLVVSLDETKRAMRLMAEKARIISEGAGALPVAAALTEKAGK